MSKAQTPSPSPAWQPKPGEGIMVRVYDVLPDGTLVIWASMQKSGTQFLCPSAAHPLPAMSPEDAEVRALATRLCALLVGRPPAIGPAVETAMQLQHELAAVRARNAKESAVEPTIPADAAPAFRVGHRVRSNWPGHKGALATVINAKNPVIIIVLDSGETDGVHHSFLILEPTTPDLAALREAVLTDAMEQQRIGHQPTDGKTSTRDYEDACVRTNASAAAYRAALAPPDPVAELRAAWERVVANDLSDWRELERGPLLARQERIKRVIAALAAMGGV